MNISFYVFYYGEGRLKYLSTRLLESEIWLECFQESGKLAEKSETCVIDQVCVCLTLFKNFLLSLLQ